MKWSYKIGRVFGIELRIHITFLLIVAYAAFIWDYLYGNGFAGALYGVFFIMLLFVFVVIHEFCHSLVAIHFGGEVSSITLLPIGGVSMMKKMPEEPAKELLVSVVGPLSNLVIAALIFPFLYVVPNPAHGTFGALTNFDVLTGVSWQAFVTYLFLINLLLAVFNLLPAFPMDGGRVFRSILAMRMPYAKATRAAVVTGEVFAVILGIFGVLTINFIAVIIAIFIYLGAQQEGAGAEMKTILSRLKVGDAVTGDVRVLAPDDTLSHVVTTVMHAYQEDFPVVEGGRLEGLLTRADLIRGLHDRGPEATVSQVMTKDFPVVKAGAPFSEVYQKMNETRARAVPVVEEGRLLGMVTLEHLSEVFMLLTATDKPMPVGPAGETGPPSMKPTTHTHAA